MAEIFDDKMADTYDDWYKTPKGMLVDKIEKAVIYEFLKPESGMEILDIGCGTGNLSLELAKLGARVTGIDISEAMLVKAREKAARENLCINFCCADANELPFEDETFDAAVSLSALEFASDLKKTLLEIYRVLKPGGRMVIGLIGGGSAWSRYYEKKAKKDPESVFRHAHFRTLDELIAAMPGENVQGKAVLFVPPDFNFEDREKALELEGEAQKQGRKDGGFICALSYKPFLKVSINL